MARILELDGLYVLSNPNASTTGGRKWTKQESRMAGSVLCMEEFELIMGGLKFAIFDKNTEEEWMQRELQCGETLSAHII